LLPVRELTQLAHEAGALVLVDAAQAAGHVPMDIAADGVDMVAFTGHKGLLGPQGTGALWVREDLDIEPLLTGGTGGDSTQRLMPPSFPDRLEAGTPNAPGIAGLLAGIEWVARRGVAALHEHHRALKARLYNGLASISGVRVLSPAAPEGVALVTLVPTRTDVSTFATRLDREFGVLIRAGIHCAPEAHRVLGSEKTGAIRFSLGWSSTEEDVDHAIDAVARVAETGKVVPVASGN
jgi:selenocysteine lyase/cysteine desulfurase